jgi:hypothetical protein
VGTVSRTIATTVRSNYGTSQLESVILPRVFWSYLMDNKINRALFEGFKVSPGTTLLARKYEGAPGANLTMLL